MSFLDTLGTLVGVVAAGRGRELTAGAVVLALMCLVYYLFELPHQTRRGCRSNGFV